MYDAYQLVPFDTNEKISTRLAVVVIVGAEPFDGHLMLPLGDAHDAFPPPVAACVRYIIKDFPDAGDGKVKAVV